MDPLQGALVAADRFLTERAGEVIALTSALVAAPTPNPPGDELAAAAVIERALELARRAPRPAVSVRGVRVPGDPNAPDVSNDPADPNV